jgi:hypothetical protein
MDEIIPYKIPVGIQRDGSELEADGCIDGQWVRWSYGRAQKIGGYREIQNNLSGPIYGTGSANSGSTIFALCGSSAKLEQIALDYTGGAGSLINRTPASGFVSSANNVWQMDSIYNSVGTNQVALAHPGQNLDDIASRVETSVFYGEVGAAATFIATGSPDVSGGVVCLHPYIFTYGNDGIINWSVPNDPTDFAGAGSGSARIDGQKIIKGVPIRGGSRSPAGLFWSLESLRRVSFVGGATIFSQDFIGNTGLLSTRAVVEYNGLYFWPSTNKFEVYNGTVQEVPNKRNKDFFFENLNYNQRQKVWGMAVPKYNEIWWFWPDLDNTECNRYIIYNTLEQDWYDGILRRSDGIDNKILRWPLMLGNEANGLGSYSLFQHEQGNNAEFVDTGPNAIQSFVETSVMQKGIGAKYGDGEWMALDGFEPDFSQVGDMMITVTGKNTANGSDLAGPVRSFTSSDEYVSIREERRQMRLRFESNTQDGFYQSGQHWMHVSEGDKSFKGKK